MRLKFWPEYEFEIQTAFSVEKILEIMQRNVAPYRFFYATWHNKPFEGKIYENKFKVRGSIIGSIYSNTYGKIFNEERFNRASANIYREIFTNENGSKIHIKMSLPIIVIVFLLFIDIAVFLSGSALIFAIFTRPVEEPMIYVFTFMFIIYVSIWIDNSLRVVNKVPEILFSERDRVYPSSIKFFTFFPSFWRNVSIHRKTLISLLTPNASKPIFGLLETRKSRNIYDL